MVVQRAPQRSCATLTAHTMAPPAFVPRAPRLTLQAPIAIRSATATAWTEGRTLNISRSGVLFSLPAAREVRGEVEFVINLSRGVVGGPGAILLPDLHCRGRIVRASAAPRDEIVLAVRIKRQLVRRARSFLVNT